MRSLLILTIIFLPGWVFAQPKLVANKITLKSGTSFNLNLATEFEIIPAAEGLKRIRFFAKAPDGRPSQVAIAPGGPTSEPTDSRLFRVSRVSWRWAMLCGRESSTAYNGAYRPNKLLLCWGV